MYEIDEDIKEMTDNLINAINASKAHKKTGEYIRNIIKPGMVLKDIAILIENKICVSKKVRKCQF